MDEKEYTIELYYRGRMVERTEGLDGEKARRRYQMLLKAGGYGIVLYQGGKRLKFGEAFDRMGIRFTKIGGIR